MKNRMVATIGAGLCVFAIATCSAAGFVPIQPVKQEYAEWCWAASIVATLNGFTKYPGVDLETTSGYQGQCLVVQKKETDPEIDCCLEEYLCSSHTASISEIVGVLNGAPYYLHTTYSLSTMTDEALDEYITTWKLPIIVAVDPIDTEALWHAVVITGLSTDLSSNTIMYPDEGRYMVLSMSDFRNGTNADFPYQWANTTFWTKSGGIPIDLMSGNQNMRYTAVRTNDSPISSYQYIFYSQNETHTGPELIVESGAKFGISSINYQKIVLGMGTNIQNGAKFCTKYGGTCTIP